MGNNWGDPTCWDEVCRRAAGRKRYNKARGLLQWVRRVRVAELLDRHGWFTYGTKARIADELRVSRSVITRDVQFFRQLNCHCPTCGSRVPRHRLPGA